MGRPFNVKSAPYSPFVHDYDDRTVEEKRRYTMVNVLQYCAHLLEREFATLPTVLTIRVVEGGGDEWLLIETDAELIECHPLAMDVAYKYHSDRLPIHETAKLFEKWAATLPRSLEESHEAAMIEEKAWLDALQAAYQED